MQSPTYVEDQLADLTSLGASLGFKVVPPLADGRIVLLDGEAPIFSTKSFPAAFSWLRGYSYALRSAEVRAAAGEPASEAPAAVSR